MLRIWETVGQAVTWYDVVEARKEFVGSPGHTAQVLAHRLREKTGSGGHLALLPDQLYSGGVPVGNLLDLDGSMYQPRTMDEHVRDSYHYVTHGGQWMCPDGHLVVHGDRRTCSVCGRSRPNNLL